MSISNFKPQIWSARVQANLDKALVLGRLVNRDYEGEVTGYGTAVKINKPGNIPVTTGYTAGSTISYATPYSSQTTLSINQRSIAGFTVDSLDQIQANVNLVETYSQRMGFSLADDIDRYLASLYVAAGAGDVTLNVSGAINAGDLTNVFAAAGQLLDTTNTPAAGRWAAISPAVHAAMAKDSRIWQGFQTADSMAARGQNYLGSFMGFDLYKSNNLLGTGVTVTLTAQVTPGDTALTCSALSASIPAGTILVFGPGRYARTTATAAAAATSISIAASDVVIPNGSAATYVKVRKCMFGTDAAITFALQKAPNMEALKDKDTTYDYVRAEQAYGAVVMEPLALGTLTVTEA
jgi:hypothetical protein